MKAYDFEFDGRLLSSFDMIICSFGSKGLETISNGSQITFNTVPVLGGNLHRLTSTSYEECLETTIQICKHSCSTDIKEISPTEFRELTKWLSRKKFLKFKILDEAHIDLYYEAAITNIRRVEIDGCLYGLELDVITNRPFALKEPRTIIVKNLIKDGKHSINDASHEEGHIYPYIEITIDDVSESANLDIYNELEDRHTIIKNCTANEVIIMDYPIIQSSVSSHDIQNDFNYNFFRIANTYENSRNDLTISLPCTIKLKYSPVVKVGI